MLLAASVSDHFRSPPLDLFKQASLLKVQQGPNNPSRTRTSTTATNPFSPSARPEFFAHPIPSMSLTRLSPQSGTDDDGPDAVPTCRSGLVLLRGEGAKLGAGEAHVT